VFALEFGGFPILLDLSWLFFLCFDLVRSMLRQNLVIFLACICLNTPGLGEAGVESEYLPSFDEVVRSFTEANGGYANIEGIKSIIANGETRLVDGEVRTFKLYRKRPNLMRLRIDLDDFSVDTIFDGEFAYRRFIGKQGRGEFTRIDGAEAKLMRSDSPINGPFLSLSRKRDALELVGFERVKGVKCYRFNVSEGLSHPVRSIWISANDLYELKHLRLLPQEDGQFVEQEVYFSDFEKVHGLSIAMAVEYWVEGKKTHESSIEEVRVNAGVFDSFFKVQK
jgi:outer membrane lipoprotein-sorting protein